MNRTIHVESEFDLSDLLSKGELVAFNVGSDATQYVVIAQKPLDYRRQNRHGASFAKIVPDEPQAYCVLGMRRGKIVLDITIADELFNIHDIQPLPEQRLLLVCARSQYRGPNDFDRNGRVYSRQGEFLREILLGDGIQAVQATTDGMIWTSYFDEGVFGNYGWDEPLGASGLVAWDDWGRKVYEFTPAKGLDTICDCYAMNVVSDSDVWIDYYTEFPLVHIRKQKVNSIWNPPISGAHGFAVGDGWVLFCGGYKRRDTYSLVELQAEGNSRLAAKVEFKDERGARLEASRVVGRGTALHLLHGTQLYRVDVSTVV